MILTWSILELPADKIVASVLFVAIDVALGFVFLCQIAQMIE
jgi:hypothetical protein